MKIMIDTGAFTPTRAHEYDAGLDLYSPVDATVPARAMVIIDTGIHAEIPVGCVGFLKSRSGLNIKHSVLSGEGVIDADYTGSIKVAVYNHSYAEYKIKRGDRITQLVILPILTPDVEIVDAFDETERGNNGFGSTGR